MYNNFSLEVSTLFKGAENEALKLKHSYVGTEHLLLSMLKNDENLISFFKEYDLSYNNFYRELITTIGPTDADKCCAIYTPLLKRVMKYALEETESSRLTSRDILIALLEIDEGVAIRILVNMDIDIEDMYDNLKKNKKQYNQKLEIFNIGKNISEDIDMDEVVVGRDKEINLIIETLIRKNKNNPLLVGEAGVGKTAIVEELARRIKKGLVPTELNNKKIVSLEMSSLVAGTKYRGEFEEKLGKVIKELESNPEIILFIDEMHTMVNAGGAEGAVNASDILKPYLARNKIKIIGATTNAEFNKFIFQDKALTRRFEVINIVEPSISETKNILYKIKPTFEKHYKITINNEVIDEIVSMSDKYILNRFNPDKSIDVLDSLLAQKRVESKKSQKLLKLHEEKQKIIKEKEVMVKNNNFTEALRLKDIEKKLNNKIKKVNNERDIVTCRDVKNYIYTKLNIPLLNNNLKNLQDYLQTKIIGQDMPIQNIIKTLAHKEESLPVSILLTGSTGVGKTQTVKEIAKYLDIPLIRLDMSEYNTEITINKLIGVSAGYIGYNDESIFDKVKINPYSCILLDELEKAHPSVINLFLQILDEGFITTAKGEKLDFKNTYIFMTSNACINNSIGFISKKGNSNYFSKEFLARLSNTIQFNDVTIDMIKKYLKKKGIEDIGIINDFDYQTHGFRGLDKYLKQLESIK